MAIRAEEQITLTRVDDGSSASIWTTSTAPTTPNYTFTISNLSGPNATPAVGDLIVYSYYRYTITSVGSTTVLAGSRTSIRGATGASSKWYTGTGITGTSTTATIFSGSGVSSAVVGDMYLNTDTGNTYRCTTAGNASTAKWVYTSNINGDDGTTFTPSVNAAGDISWTNDGGKPNPATQNIKGPQGNNGYTPYIQGGYWYINGTSTGVKAEGEDGTTSVWYYGTSITGTSTTPTVFSGSGIANAVVGDMYLNTGNSNVYQCTLGGNASTAKWVYAGTIADSVFKVKTKSGSTVTITDASNYPALDLVADINPRQSGSGTPSPDNIMPISGSTEVNTYVDPTYGGSIEWNQLVDNGDFSNGTTGWSAIRGTLSANNNILTCSRSSTGYVTVVRTIADVQNHKCYIGFDVSVSNVGLTISGSFSNASINTNTFASNVALSQANTFERLEYIYTPTSSGATQICVGTNMASINGSISLRNVFIVDLTECFGSGNEPTTVADFKALFAKTYYAYNSGTTTCVSAVNDGTYGLYTTPLSRTVYGGTLNVTNGLLTVTHTDVDLGGLSWQSYGSGSNQRWGSTGIASLVSPPASDNTLADILCEAFPVDTFDNLYGHVTDNRIGVGTNGNIYCYSSQYTSASAFKTAMNGIKLVYKLATPVTYQLTPQQVELLTGTNYVWADTGNSTVVYSVMSDDAAQTLNTIKNIAESATQYAWHTETDTGAGAGTHITAIPKEEFLQSPSGYNTLFDNIGMKIRNALKTMASYGAKAVIGEANEARVEIAPTALEMVSKDGATAIKIESSNQTAPSYISININIPIMYDTPAEFELDNTIAPGTVVTVEVLDDVGYFLPTDFTIGTAYTYTDPFGYTITYDGSYSFTATCTQAADGQFTVSGARYTKTVYVPHTTLGGMVKITDTPFNSYSLVAPSISVTDTYNGLVVNGVSITRLINSPNAMIDATDLTPVSSRCEVTSGGVIKVGKWRFVQLVLTIKASLSANNTWGLLSGFDLPVTGSQCALAASVQKNYGNVSADIAKSGNLVVQTAGAALANNDVLLVTGFYIAQ